MLTKITSALLVLALGCIAWMAISHSADIAEARHQAEAARIASAAAIKAKDDAVARAEAAERANRSNQQAIASLTVELGNQRLLADQAQERARSIQARYDALNLATQEALQNDPATRDWASNPLPAAVASGRLLYRPGAQGGHGDRDQDGGAAAAQDQPVPADHDPPPGQRRPAQ